jgi:hypothetical protein
MTLRTRSAWNDLQIVPIPSGAQERFRLSIEALHNQELRYIMRSKLVFDAGIRIQNRFLLAATVMRAAKKLHVNSTRSEDTVNEVFAEVAKGTYAHGELPEIVPPAPIDALVISTAV